MGCFAIDLYLTQLAEESRFRAWGGGNLLNGGVDLLKRGLVKMGELMLNEVEGSHGDRL